MVVDSSGFFLLTKRGDRHKLRQVVAIEREVRRKKIDEGTTIFKLDGALTVEVSIGTDIIEVNRIRDAINRHGRRFLDRLFTPKEQTYCNKHRLSERHYAGRFAAKEAIAKAFGTGFGKDLAFNDIEILNNASGKPLVTIRGEPQQHLALSISHCKEYATASAIILKWD